MKSLRVITTSIPFVLLASTFPALAHAADDRFTLRLGAMHAEGSGALSGSLNGQGSTVAFDESIAFGSKEISPRIDGAFQISQRNRLIFDYLRYSKDARSELGRDLQVGDELVTAGTFAKADVNFHLASLIYDFSIVNSQVFSAGLQIGAEYARLDGEVFAQAGETSYRTSAKVDGYAPVVGVRLTATPARRWVISTQAQYLDAGWGSFDFDGSIERANALVEFRLTDMLGVFAGYDYFKINYRQSGRDASGSFDLKFQGPTAGVTLAF